MKFDYKKNSIIAVAILFMLTLIGFVVIYKLVYVPKQQRGDADNDKEPILTEKEARAIAEQFCIKSNEVLSNGSYNKATKTWLFNVTLNETPKGCDPVCAVSETTKTARINWRCTGYLPGRQKAADCGIANCHGLDIECGKPVEMCPGMYQIGDGCRQFAKCEIVNGQCQQVDSLEFNVCKSCVQKCEKDFADNPEKAFICESKCMK